MPRREIDPQLPFVQLHRSAVQKCATLAAMNGLHQAHALGAMALFWTDLSDRRRLVKWLESPEQACILPAEELVGRIRMAFGKDIPLGDLVLVGFLEPRDASHYRVRGMSRQLATEAKRLKIPFEEQSGSPRGRPEVAPGPAEVRGERREVRGDSEAKLPAGPPAPAGVTIEEAFQAVPPERRDPNLRAFSDALCSEFTKHRDGAKYDWQGAKDTEALKRIQKHGIPEVIRRWRNGLTADFGRIHTVAQLAMKWNDFAAAQVRRGYAGPEPEHPPLPRITEEVAATLYEPGGLYGTKKRNG
jgi:hypothetical protein